MSLKGGKANGTASGHSAQYVLEGPVMTAEMRAALTPVDSLTGKERRRICMAKRRYRTFLTHHASS